jgi:hypothetical protein
MKADLTAGGKKLELVVDKKTAQLRFQFSPGGELPQELQGTFTCERYAQQAKDKYLAKDTK